MISLEDVDIIEVGNQWFYTIDEWVGTRGPFESYDQAYDALMMEVQDYRGR